MNIIITCVCGFIPLQAHTSTPIIIRGTGVAYLQLEPCGSGSCFLFSCLSAPLPSSLSPGACPASLRAEMMRPGRVLEGYKGAAIFQGSRHALQGFGLWRRLK